MRVTFLYPIKRGLKDRAAGIVTWERGVTFLYPIKRGLKGDKSVGGQIF